ncbi:putative transmembrane protein [Candidatus Burkholderia verschuerenii]|uniref:Putative transmembrane protein n=1 Tax=Candidatus Burkholderia verschuerenii TaxID=242163 RepID=A0A0L0MF29_9BURK|nr:VanZ family protein [Candidatus Burkholderia verschuerenii]KND60911.1 putative transmembrane protein [Candidatus Burkholderia verschuerenii]
MTIKQWQRRPSAFSRQALIAYAALVVYGSLYPFSGWRSLGIGPFAYLADPIPQYLTVFDVVTNVIGYMPLGALIVLALYPRWRGSVAVCAALFGGALLSGAMEAIQTYLPTRVASNLDLAANAFGALLGGVLISPATSALLDRGLLRRMRFMWFERNAAYVIGLSALWPFATLFPAQYLFGGGDLPRELWDGLDPNMQDAILAWIPVSWDFESWPDRLGALLPDESWEALITASNLFAALVLATLLTRARAPRIRIMLVLILSTLFAKVAASFLQSRSGLTFDWATDGALEGILIGTVAAVASVSLPRALRAACAGAAMVVALVLANLLPVNPYFDIVLADWRQGRYLHFNGLLHWLAWVWPYAALGWLASIAEHAWLARRRGRKGKDASRGRHKHRSL